MAGVNQVIPEQEEVAFSLMDELNASTVSVNMITPMTAEQEVIYNAVKRTNKGAFIAGGFPSFNARWKASFADVDMYIPLYVRLQQFRRSVEVFVEVLYKNLCVLVPSIPKHTVLYDFGYEHESKGLIRLQIKKYGVDIVLRAVPQPPRLLNDRDKRLYGILYVLSGFDNMFCRVAIVDYNPIASTMLVLGSYEAAEAEARVKIYIIRECQKMLELKIRSISRRHRNPDLRVWTVYQRTITRAYNRILKYLPAEGRETVNYLHPRSLLICLPYGINPNLRKVLPTCMWFLENEVKKTPALVNLLLEYQMAINFYGAEEVVEEENLPQIKKLRRCNMCRYRR